MAFWGVEVKSGEPHVVEPSPHGRRLRITQATLGDCGVLGWSTVEASGAAALSASIRLCALNPVHNPVSSLDLQIGDDEGIVVSVTGDSSVHLAGYYYDVPPPAAASCTNQPTAAAAGLTITEQHQHIPDNSTEDTHKKQRVQQDYEEVISSDEETIPDHIDHHHGNTQRRGRNNNKKRRMEEDDVHASETENASPQDDDDDIDHDSNNESRDEDDTDGDDLEKESEKSDDEISSPDTSDSKEGGAGDETEITNPSSAVAEAGASSFNQATDKRVKTETILTPEAHHHDEVIADDLNVGTGDEILNRNTTVKVKYSGKLLGRPQIVDPTDGNDIYTFKISASQVIRGWEHIVGMRVGGKRRLTIPPSLGYGENGKGGAIPPNSWLVYELELLQILPRQKKAPQVSAGHQKRIKIS